MDRSYYMTWEEFRQQITEYFDIEELRTLCFDLGIDYDNLRGEGKEAKIRELVALVRRKGRIPKLVELLSDRRTNVSWESPNVTPWQPGDWIFLPSRTFFVIFVILTLAGLGIWHFTINYCGGALTDALAYITRATEHRENGNYRCASRDFQAGLKIAGSDEIAARLYYGLTTVALAEDNPTQAHQYAENGLSYNLDDPLLYLADGLALCRLQRNTEAVRQLEKFLETAGVHQIPVLTIPDLTEELRTEHNVADPCYMVGLELK